MRKFLSAISIKEENKNTQIKIIAAHILLYIFLFYIVPLVKNGKFTESNEGKVTFSIVNIVFMLVGMLIFKDKLSLWLRGLFTFIIMMIIYTPPGLYELADGFGWNRDPTFRRILAVVISILLLIIYFLIWGAMKLVRYVRR